MTGVSTTTVRGRSQRVGEFAKFCVVGVVGFVANAASVEVFSRITNLYIAGLLSWIAAATVTWFLNRIWTFSDRKHASRGGQWLRFLAANSVGLCIYYVAYALSIYSIPWFSSYPTAAVAVGSLAGLAANFMLSSRAVFR